MQQTRALSSTSSVYAQPRSAATARWGVNKEESGRRPYSCAHAAASEFKSMFRRFCCHQPNARVLINVNVANCANRDLSA